MSRPIAFALIASITLAYPVACASERLGFCSEKFAAEHPEAFAQIIRVGTEIFAATLQDEERR